MRFMNRFFAMIAVLAVGSRVICPQASAQTTQQAYIWRNVKVGAGGFIPGIVFSRVEKGLVYLRSDMGGCYRWDDSQKIWVPLQDPMAESSYFGGESIAPDPIDANTVYVAAGMYRSDPSAMLRSHDRGKTWDVFPVSFRMGGNEDGRSVGERLAIDPNETSILYFGSRNDGLWRSTDSAQTWTKVAAFPIRGRGTPGDGQPSNTGLSFVVFDPRTGSRGTPTRTIFVGSADPGPRHLFRSDDAGKTWIAVAGGPGREMLPAQAQIDDQGVLYITYGNGTGPNGVSDGAVMKFDIVRRWWTDITPDKRRDHPKGGYCGLSLDRERPGTLAVSTMNRWMPVDTVWRSTDGGRTWMDIADKSIRDVRAAPFLLWGKDQAKLGWWMAALAIDPFDSDHVAYSTGATIYATNDFSNVSSGRATHWYPWVEGIEQTAILTLLSPSEGAHLLSGFGDIGGFVHDDLSVSPPGMYENPQFGSTVSLDCAGQNPLVIVRGGQPNGDQASLGYSEDGGRSWQPLKIPYLAGRRFDIEHPPITVCADGSTFMVSTPIPVFTRDRGKNWIQVKGLFYDARPIADRVDPSAFYAMNFNSGRLFVSTDGGASFKNFTVKGLPADIRGDEPTWHEGPWPLVATPGKPHDLWFISGGTLYHSADGGKNFAKADGTLNVQFISFGKAAEGTDYPSIFVVASQGAAPGGIKAIWRSDDIAVSWVRVNDDLHQYGTRFRCIAGDPRVFGRVYVGTDGRGIFYGQPVGTGE
jgi:xyloglucan-specific exo-beta-1,4-glucanase